MTAFPIGLRPAFNAPLYILTMEEDGQRRSHIVETRDLIATIEDIHQRLYFCVIWDEDRLFLYTPDTLDEYSVLFSVLLTRRPTDETFDLVSTYCGMNLEDIALLEPCNETDLIHVLLRDEDLAEKGK